MVWKAIATGFFFFLTYGLLTAMALRFAGA